MHLRAHEYWLLLKPRILLAMVALYSTSYIASFASLGQAPFDFPHFVIGFVAVSLAVSGSNALNCYLDRDIDALMVRTRRRPIPRGVVEPKVALVFGLLLLASAAAISLYLGVVPFLLLIIEGAGFYLVAYTILLKRRTSLNVLATAPSVAAPSWFGWFMGGAPLNAQALVLGLIVAVWGPLHLWSIAYTFAEDYLRGEVPMLPSVLSPGRAVYSIVVSLLVLVSSTYFLAFLAGSILFTLAVSVINIPLLFVGARFYVTPSKRRGWWIFKLTAPYIVIVLSAFMIDKYLSV